MLSKEEIREKLAELDEEYHGLCLCEEKLHGSERREAAYKTTVAYGKIKGLQLALGEEK